MMKMYFTKGQARGVNYFIRLQIVEGVIKMKNNEKNKVYIISGPAGVGKSTTSKELVKQLKQSAYVSGDDISHMHINGRLKPWESKEELALIWNNILSLTKNFISFGIDIVIDYVTFPEEAKWLSENLVNLDVEVKYIVLWTDNKTLINRDNMRQPEYRMGDRCLMLVDEFMESNLDKKHLFDTSNNICEISLVIDEIKENQKYKVI
ncbi:AAA domain-containing protein [Gracilibacillus orientalis]|uniref:AAA domain-containing protein n=2 Tax=Gracilibacillus orientalis TaxID=334253 RepID=A0A1I4M6D0_9BACI|nr:AAA domain-containing protein [Gracilibacillus orientalis]